MAEQIKLSYHGLSRAIQDRIREDRARHWVNPYRFDDTAALRRNMTRDRANIWRPTFVRDTEKILHLPFYNRYADKTQVFSFYHNDDLTRRALHVQLVSRIARNIGMVLGLNLDLIEAIALGHDIGHTPFGHAGERFLDELLWQQTGRHFAHNVQSVRVLDRIFGRNLTLQTLNGILSHNGELAQQTYHPKSMTDFAALDAAMEACGVQGDVANRALAPSTLEGCVVRICDMIAYLGKDRQDAAIAHIVPESYPYSTSLIGRKNAQIINNLTVDIIENSYAKDCICLSEQAFADLKTAKDENYRMIYGDERIEREYRQCIGPMFSDVYFRLLEELEQQNEQSLIYRHHIAFVERNVQFYEDDRIPYRMEEPNQIVADYIASMTDDYFLALYQHLFPDSRLTITFHSYFED